MQNNFDKKANDRSVVIIDGYSSGALFVPELQKRGFTNLIHVQSTQRIPESYRLSFDETSYQKNIPHNSIEETTRILKDYQPLAIIPGAEIGVNLADQLSEALDLRTNGTRLSEARRNKYLMAEAVRAAGIPAVRQIKTSRVEEAIAFQKKI